MLYELHLTVDPRTDIVAWGNWCVELGIKPLEIHLAEGEHPVQKMFATTFEGEDFEAFEWMQRLIIAAEHADYEYDHLCYDTIEFGTGEIARMPETPGFKVIRAKLEVPLDKSAQYTMSPYHECHVKSLIRKDLVDTLVEVANRRDWSASTNVLFPETDGLQKWYFTKRDYRRADYLRSAREFKEAFAELPTELFNAVRMESEAVIYDTNPALDHGWA